MVRPAAARVRASRATELTTELTPAANPTYWVAASTCPALITPWPNSMPATASTAICSSGTSSACWAAIRICTRHMPIPAACSSGSGASTRSRSRAMV